MSKQMFFLAILSLSFFLLFSCTSWHSLKFETEAQPIQFGPHLLKTPLDTLGVISGLSTHNVEEDTQAGDEYFNITFEGKDEKKENINTTIYSALYDDPQHFIADGQVVVEVEYGMSLGSVFLGMIASMITDDEADVGTYSLESIYYNGIVYKIKNPNEKDDE